MDLDRASPPTLGSPRRLVHSGKRDREARFSPDGRWVAFSSNASGTEEVYVTLVRGDGRQWQVSAGGGMAPRWRRDGKELFYLTPDGRVCAVAVTTREADVDLGTPAVLLPALRPAAPARDPSLAVNGDGTRFLVVINDSRSAPDLLTIVTGWASLATTPAR